MIFDVQIQASFSFQGDWPFRQQFHVIDIFKCEGMMLDFWCVERTQDTDLSEKFVVNFH